MSRKNESLADRVRNLERDLLAAQGVITDLECHLKIEVDGLNAALLDAHGAIAWITGTTDVLAVIAGALAAARAGDVAPT